MKNNKIDYFPLAIDFFDDDKIALIEYKFGYKGSYTALRLLCKIYSEGYYYLWSQDKSVLFAKKLGEDFTPEFVSEVVSELMQVGFLEESLYRKYGILTSKAIQLRFFEIVKRRQRIEVIAEYLLLDVSGFRNVEYKHLPDTCTPTASNTDCKQNVNTMLTECQQNVTSMQHDVTLKESKVKKSKENIIINDDVKERKSPTATERQKFDFEKAFARMQTDSIWIESIRYKYNIPNEQLIADKLRQFKLECTCRDKKNHDNLSDLKQHFCNWLTIQQRQKNELDSKIQRESDKRGRTPVCAASKESYYEKI